ncbi:hypothetical protein MMC08_004396 [Hypocenomyce scalaris]|nr:hypothetical protein [Hypocenomyce scalaris]
MAGPCSSHPNIEAVTKPLIEVSKLLALKTVLELGRADILGPQLHALLLVLLVVEPSHVQVHGKDETDGESAKASRDGQGGNVLWSILRQEDVAGSETGEGSDCFNNGSDEGSSTLVWRVVVIPCGKKRRGDRTTGTTQEASEIGHPFVRDHVDLGENNEADHSERQSSGDMEGSVSKMIRRIREADQCHRTEDVGRNGEQVGLFASVAKSSDDLHQEGADAVQGHSVTDPDYHVAEEELVFKTDFDGILEDELGVNGVRRVDGHAPISDFLFLFGQKLGTRCVVREKNADLM